MPENRLTNLLKDLTKARQQALLIEVLKGDLASWSDQGPDPVKAVCDASAKVFDAGLKGEQTNVLWVSRAEGKAQASIFGALLAGLDKEFDDLHKREILNKLTGFGLNQAFGGAVGEAASDSLSVGAERMMDYVADWAGSASDFLASFSETAIDVAADEVGDVLESIGEEGMEAITDRFSSADTLYLSRAARKRLKDLAPRLSDKATSHEALQLALEMLLVTAEGAPKVIVINDPLQLDDASLALLAMLVSLEKDLRQVNQTDEAEAGRAQTAGISVVLTFTDTQPHDTLEGKAAEEKLRAISRLRMMASRYSLLERLDSDIPVPAVRASTFVGREAELNRLWQDWHAMAGQPDSAAAQTWAVIKGEPGTGKTALANRFIQQVRADAHHPGSLAIPVLRMLNQTGHSAQATGLASLKNAIADELRRLNLMYQENVGLVARTRQKLGGASRAAISDAKSDDPQAKKRTWGRLGGLISKLVGVDSAMEVGRSVKSLSEQDEMSSLRQEEFGQSSKANQKDEQYELLRGALSEMSQLAHKCLPEAADQTAEKPQPMILLVDDLQWMDDFTAEFLVNEWPANLPVYVIATARGSDSFAAVTESRVHQGSNRFRNSLFAELGVIDAATVSADERLDISLSLAGHLDLKGMDQPMLANLIRLTYRNITAEQAEPFAAAVIRNLAGEAGASDIITLFAIETLNVISDPQFYRRNAELPRLIEPEGTDRYRFKAPESTNLTQALDAVFKKLTDAYQASYLIDSEQGTGGARFNLASYAILEERLHLIEQHFGEHGGAARYSLLFSALLGAPFNSLLVRDILDHIANLDPDHHPELAPFLQDFQKNAPISLAPEQFELLERAYEIIRKLKENVETAGEYVYQHDLLRQFFLSQFTRSLLALYPSLESLKGGAEALINQIESVFDQWFDERLEKSGQHHCKLKVEVRGYWYRLMSSHTRDLGAWVGAYGESLLHLVGYVKKKWSLAEALSLAEEANYIFSSLYTEGPTSWALGYAVSLSELASTLNALGLRSEAVSPYEEAMLICRSGYGTEPDSWAVSYVVSLNNLALALYEPDLEFDAETREELGMEWESVSLLEEALLICRLGHEASPEKWARHYVNTLFSLAGILNELDGDYEDNVAINDAFRKLDGVMPVNIGSAPDSEVLPLYNEAMSISRAACERSPELWAEKYVTSLHWIAVKLFFRGGRHEAWPIAEEALSISRSGYEEAPALWTGAYAKSLRMFAALISVDRESGALPLFKEAVSVCKSSYQAEPTRWAQDYAESLEEFAKKLISADRESEALPLLEDAVSVCRSSYEAEPARWAGGYAASLRNFADRLISVDRQLEALSPLKEALFIYRSGYHSAPARWNGAYIATIELLAKTLEGFDRSSEALPFFADALSTLRLSYAEAPERLKENYVASLKQLAESLIKVGHGAEALCFFEEALSVLRLENEVKQGALEEKYLAILVRLASTLYELDRVPETVPLLEEALSIHRSGYDSLSTTVTDVYTDSLGALALVFSQLGESLKAFPLLDEALLINRQRYEVEREKWAREYVDFLIGFAETQKTFGRDSMALPTLEEALSIILPGYESYPEKWAEAYSKCMAALIRESDINGHSLKALAYSEELLAIYRQDYEFVFLPAPSAALSILCRGNRTDPERCSKAYVECLTILAEEAETDTSDFFEPGKDESKALRFLKEAVSVCRSRYEVEPSRWGWDYAEKLKKFADKLISADRESEALPLQKELVSVRRAGYERDPERWAGAYATSLANVALTHNRLGRPEDALPLLKEALSIRRAGYETAPELWAKAYASSIGNLAMTLEDKQDLPRSLQIWQEAKDLTSDGSSLKAETRLPLRMKSLIRSASLLRMLKRYPEAFAELDATQSLLTEMDQAAHPERHYFRAWSLIVRATTSVEAGDLAASRALFPKAEALIHDHRLEDLVGGLESLRSDIEGADHSGG